MSAQDLISKSPIPLRLSIENLDYTIIILEEEVVSCEEGISLEVAKDVLLKLKCVSGDIKYATTIKNK